MSLGYLFTFLVHFEMGYLLAFIIAICVQFGEKKSFNCMEDESSANNKM